MEMPRPSSPTKELNMWSQTLDRVNDDGDETITTVDLDNLYPALVECFGIIFLGYLAARFNIMSNVEAKGLNVFVSTFALPALIFGSLCRLQLEKVQWMFLVAIFLAKSILFFVVLLVTLIMTRPSDFGRAGLFGIFVTQSNDFALGYPILMAIYEKTHPECPMYLYLIAPISFVILNPIGFVCLEIAKSSRENDGPSISISSNARTWALILRVGRGVLSNPIILMTVAGILGNIACQGTLPAMADQFLQTLGSTFSGCALFSLGIRMVSKTGSRLDLASLTVPAVLIMLKTLALPVICRESVNLFQNYYPPNDTEHLSNFAFLYGTFPAAPGVFVFASKYDIEANLIANAMVACTFVAAPIMFISARLLSITNINPSDYIQELDIFLFDISIIGLICSLWVAFTFVAARKFQRVPHFLTLSLVISQCLACIGAMLWSKMSCTHGWKLYFQFTVFTFGVYASRINAALLSLVMLVIELKSVVWVQQGRRAWIAIGLVVPGFLVLMLLLVVGKETQAHGDKRDPNFQYGMTQAYVALVVLVVSFLVTVASLIMRQRCRKLPPNQSLSSPHGENLSHLRDSGAVPREGMRRRLLESPQEQEEDEFGGDTSPSIIDIPTDSNLVQIEEDIHQVREAPVATRRLSDEANEANRSIQNPGGRYRCTSEHREYCSELLDNYDIPPVADALICRARYEDEHQILRHSLLLVSLSASMFVGIALCTWTLLMDSSSGIYLELVFLDGFLNLGQGIFALALFGFDSQYFLFPIQKFWRRLIYGQDSLVLPDWEDLDRTTKLYCQQFLRYHIEKCMESLLRDVRVRLTTYQAVFRGQELVDWLMEVGLSRDRNDALIYGRHLLKGRVIRHVEDHLDFYDDVFLYSFHPLRE
ncbi:hypothetical protein TCAL_12136 [Tigriopus californicus]|uniref:DEP domain-containing protein n=2 Tax=Tigriopus californicus TaxID=6832 RepID=A0A553PBB6_TIGCA|nr:integral membrane protein GPR155-like isoform X2 [Tigriopus californicus]XP_059078283.1 integral membrane protein GPR155-like isoform X2 [Tigriopus californicus]XP_059078284.1 integral membrane protein GPR155-like isoform X2 [Tigriopus californicus]TRY74981.1 hypothetical protein TCAL_12136 [Tigriopus californicus]|eukprot:TCALIF_12136-PA protein Name:"Similar to GPR155 Integral membrane protein GPR155 (Homo sapiens)" AED:0.06 eAED:0.06 QI:67/1/1/1/0.5/0.66/3/231/879